MRELQRFIVRGLLASPITATAVGIAAILSLGACSGSGAAQTTGAASTMSQPDAAGGAAADGDITPPDATLPGDFSEEARQGWAPIEFSGKQRPPYDKDAETDPAIGQAAPTFVGYDIDDQVTKVDPAEQGKTMIVLVAHWCGNCNKEVPEIVAMHDDGEIPDDVNVIAVLTGSKLDHPGWPPDEWIRTLGWPYESVYDGVVKVEVDGAQNYSPASMAYYGFGGYHAVVLVDADGVVVDRWSGLKGRDQMKQRIDAGFEE